MLWGGTYVHASFYKQKSHPWNQQHGDEPIERDLAEWHMMREAIYMKIPIIGICRGAQFLCVMAGGSLYQHVRGHNIRHGITTFDKQQFIAEASHHQMMNLDDTNHELLAWASNGPLSQIYEREVSGRSNPGAHLEAGEPEVVYFPEIKGLAIQPHPEWHNSDGDTFVNWILKETAKLVL